MINKALQNWKHGNPSIGTWINLPDLHTSETLARMGSDWLCFDLQHGLMSYSHLLALIPAISGTDATPLVRIAKNNVADIGRALDAGAHGVIVPMVNTSEEAAQAVAACRYPPDGIRSCGPMRGAMLEGFEYLKTANEQIACIVMIETKEGFDNVDAIAATPGVDALFIGPMDLTYGLGLPPGSFADPAFLSAVKRIKSACKKHDRAIGMFGYDPEFAKKAVDDGFSFVSAGTDTSFFRRGAGEALAIVNGTADQADAPRGGY